MKKEKNNLLRTIMAIIIMVITVNIASALVNNGYQSAQIYQPTYQTFNDQRGLDTSSFWQMNNNDVTCNTGQDIVLEIIPGSCSPSVVRSDLLESQNVPVFCPVVGINLNPLIDIGQISSVSFAGAGGLPEGVAGISFYPYRAGVTQKNDLFTSPGIANVGNSLGYVVVVLKQVQTEKEMPNAIIANLTANIKYDVKKVFGSGRAEYFLSRVTDGEWSEEYKNYGVFKGEEYLRLEELSIDGTQARVAIYKDKDTKINTVNLKLGEESPLINAPGLNCGVGMRIKFSGLEAPRKKVQLQVDQDQLWLYEGQKFLNEQCVVRSIDIIPREKNNGLEKTKVQITCPKGSISLELSELDQSLGIKNLGWEEVLKGAGDDSTKKAIIENFERAKEQAYLVADLYTNEKRSPSEGGQYYGLEDLKKFAKVAFDLGQFKTALETQEKIVAKYSGTSDELEALRIISELKNYSYEKASATTNVDFSLHTITLKSYKNPAISEASVEFDRPVEPRIIGDLVYPTDVNAGGELETWVRIREIKKDSIILQAKITETIKDSSGKEQKKVRTGDFVMTLGQTLATVPGLNLSGLNQGNNVQLKKINLEEEIKIVVNPEIASSAKSGNFTFKVGIEKRGIKISTEKTQEMIENINKSIEKFTQITNKLGQAVETGKAACLAGSATLFIKNFIANTGGAAGARGEVMSGPNGWYEKCNRLVADQPSKYSNLNDCLLQKNTDIENDVKSWTEAEKNVNTQFDNVYNSEDISGSQKEFIKQFASDVCGNKFQNKQIVIDGNNKKICGDGGVFKDEKAIIAAYDNGAFTIADAKQVMTASQTYGGEAVISDSSQGLGAQRINGFFSNMYRRPEITTANNAGALGDAAGRVFTAYSPDSRVGNVEVIEVKDDGKLSSTINGMPRGTYSLISVAQGTVLPDSSKGLAGKVLIAPVTTDAQGNVQLDTSDPSRMKTIDNNGATGSFKQEDYNAVLAANKLSGFKAISASQSSCNNFYRNPRVKYFTSGQYSGLPAVVPIDQTRGWYVATKDSELAPFTEAGQVRTFWICNVGKDGLEQFDSSVADDKSTCFQINIDRGTPIDQSYCFNAAETTQMINRAQEAIRQAGKYDQGRTKTNILGTNFEVERVASSAPGTQCQDFMSPSDCNIMFNLCDPVICPPSRCDLGGTYRVDDVVQSGIAGSIALCLPNAKEGIYVPVCLSGIYAGFDAYTSVLRAHRDCLQNSLETGQYTGLCDEVRSVYMCEFFWKQATPIIKAGIPKLIEGLFGNNRARAGGEYSNFQKAWNTADQSVNYFTQVYGKQALGAFNIKSTADIGTQVCRQFASANYPDSGNLFDAMIKPESPTQFYAQFEEIPYSEATVPPTSQYNVFYHIYAGRERGTYFTIYLKNPPENGLYASAERITINQGFIAAGEYDSQKIERTLPAGYRELCVNINGKDECGFGKVTTDYGINYLSDQYAKEQGTKQGITSEESCINGESSVYSLLTPNIEQAANDALNPAIYKQGIIRMCASQNPGQNAGDNTGIETTRWEDVGYCSDQRIRCWLDKNSVKDVIKSKGIQNQTLTAVSAQLNSPTIPTAEEKINGARGLIGNPGMVGISGSGFYPSRFFSEIIDPMTIIEEQALPSFTKARATDTKFLAFIRVVEELMSSQTSGSINTIVNNVAAGAAQIKKDCEITGYVVPTGLVKGRTLPFIIKFTGQCNDWNIVRTSLISADKNGDVIVDPNLEHTIKSTERENFKQDITVNQLYKHYLNITITYKDKKTGQEFTELGYSGKGKNEFEVREDSGAIGSSNQGPGATGK